MVERVKLRVAIAGCHRMLLRDLTNHNFAAAFNAVPDTEIVGVFDYGEETRVEFVECWREVLGDIPTYGDYRRMLDEVRPDLLCIATRQTMHVDQVEAAVAAGVRGILCDKPLATSLDEMDRILAACGEIPLAFGLDRRWSERYRYLRETMTERIGSVTGLIAFGLPNTINHGCHWYDSLLALLGDPQPVWVSGLIDDTGFDNSRRRMDPPSRAQIGFDNGVVGYITTDGLKGQSFEVFGARGLLFICADASEVYLWRQGAGRVEPICLPFVRRRWPEGPAMVRDLVETVRRGGRTACDIDQARRATEIGFAIHDSSRKGGARVDLSEVDRSLRVESFPWGNEGS